MNSLVEAGVCLSGAGDFVGVVCVCSRDSLGGDGWGTDFCGVDSAALSGAARGFIAVA